MTTFDLDAYVSRSRTVDVSDIAWHEVRRYPLRAGARRTLLYMQDIESQTVVYLRELLATRAIDDPEVATFLACWLYEETFHGRVLAQFLTAAGESIRPRERSRVGMRSRIESVVMGLASRAWPDFVAVHMTWGAINELTTLVGYKRLSEVAGHPILAELLSRITRDESRHFSFYFRHAEQRLQRPAVARVTRFLVDHFWAPVGSGVRPAADVRFLAEYLFSGREGRAAGQRIDKTIQRLPGFADARPIQSWINRDAGVALDINDRNGRYVVRPTMPDLTPCTQQRFNPECGRDGSLVAQLEAQHDAIPNAPGKTFGSHTSSIFLLSGDNYWGSPG